jgi:hypothetical protein
VTVASGWTPQLPLVHHALGLNSLEVRDVGGLLRTDRRLYVHGRDRTKLVTAVTAQVDLVRSVLPGDPVAVPITAVLCFVGGDWPLFQRKGLRIGGVHICPPRALPNLVGADGPLNREMRAALSSALSAAMPEA